MLFIYIHGFNSSPDSFKAKCFSKFLSIKYPFDEFIAPELSDQPSKAIQTLSHCIEHNQSKKIGFIGSSLGGFYATWLAEKYGNKAVLVNPAVNPHELLVDYLGENTNYYTGEQYEFTSEHIQQLKYLTLQQLKKPKNLLVLLQSGDEILDYRLAKKKYSEAHLNIESGGDHSFQNFELHFEKIYQFFQ
ncbi:MAG: esterase YqiA [Gammaproteobacteria bacterium]|nr:esterase YqiA [Gammaproteobacteria bacterium]